jgi:hypothetical protein
MPTDLALLSNNSFHKAYKTMLQRQRMQFKHEQRRSISLQL